MARVRVSTTVDETLLRHARAVCAGGTDAVVIDAALAALVRAHRSAEIDEAYQGYERVPLETPDAWGDLASFHDAADRA